MKFDGEGEKEGGKFIRGTRLIHRFRQIGFDLNGWQRASISKSAATRNFPI